jgi:hypothetical protein
MTKTRPATAVEQITRSILVLRGHRVLLDAELAALYGVTTKRLNEQVKRNAERFPADFMFQLTAEENHSLRSQIATSNTMPSARGGRRNLPYAFTEHGAIQAANVLNTSRAVEMGIYVVRAFVQLRDLLASNKELARQFAQLESRLNKKLLEHEPRHCCDSFCHSRTYEPAGTQAPRHRLYRKAIEDQKSPDSRKPTPFSAADKATTEAPSPSLLAESVLGERRVRPPAIWRRQPPYTP